MPWVKDGFEVQEGIEGLLEDVEARASGGGGGPWLSHLGAHINAEDNAFGEAGVVCQPPPGHGVERNRGS